MAAQEKAPGCSKMEAECTSIAASARGKRLAVSLKVALVGLCSYCVCCLLLCHRPGKGSIGNAAIEEAFRSQTPQEAYTWPLVAFGTAFSLNFLALLFERDSAKTQLALLASYINFLAGLSDYLAWKGLAPVMLDVWGGGLAIMRVLMWLHTTPAMVYLLSLISDFSRTRVMLAVGADILMVILGITAHLSPNLLIASVIYVAAFSLFGFVIKEMWQMFDAPLEDASNECSRHSLKILRLFTVGLWFSLPVVFFVVKAGLVSIGTEEWLWTMADFLGKVMFSSSLLYGNFLTIEQRRLIAMRIVEESNRIQVIQELRDLVEQKERFMSSMSHELRTPLNGIIGLSEAIVSGSCGTINEQAMKTINTIKTSGSRLLALINDILDAASMRMGQLVIKQEKVPLSRVVEDVVQLCQPLAKKGVQIVNGVSETLPAVLGDAGRIIQIFHNLIGNSCKFTHYGWITVSAMLKGDCIEVLVQDTGIGIPESRFEHIFQAFEQVDMSTTRKYGGTGLGLSLVKQLVEAHGGTVTVTSTMDIGTTFAFTLKCWQCSVLDLEDSDHEGTAASRRRSSSNAPPPAAASKLRSVSMAVNRSPNLDTVGSSSPAPLSGRQCPSCQASLPVGVTETVVEEGQSALEDVDAAATVSVLRKRSFTKKGGRTVVLSVDDDPVNQMVVQNLLLSDQYEVIQAMDGAEALEALEKSENLPDVILLDVMMPGMSGYEVCRKLRQHILYKCIPVIMVSAKGKEENIVEGLNSGSSDYLVKPFGRNEILARISSHIHFRNDVYVAGLEDGSGSGPAAAPAVEATPEATANPDRDKELLERQLEEVSEECARLQEVVDALELKQSQQVPPVPVNKDVVAGLKSQNQKLEQKVQQMEGLVEKVLAQERQVEVQLEEAEGQLLNVQQQKRVLELQLRDTWRRLSELQQQDRKSKQDARCMRIPPATKFGSVPLLDPGMVISVQQGGTTISAPLPSVSRPTSQQMMMAQRHSAGSYSGSHSVSAGHSPAGIDFADCDHETEELLLLLSEAGLEHLFTKFVAEEITPSMVPHLSNDALVALGVSSVGARVRLRALASALR